MDIDDVLFVLFKCLIIFIIIMKSKKMQNAECTKNVIYADMKDWDKQDTIGNTTKTGKKFV